MLETIKLPCYPNNYPGRLRSSRFFPALHAILLSALLVSGCSSSNDPQSNPGTETVNSDPLEPGTQVENTTSVVFDITVPEYVSESLQVRLLWGDKDIAANWVTDESWTVSESFPSDTENLLTVTFYDQNGAITLGSFEQTFRTGTNASESFVITADQFDTSRWDDDSDGVSNLDELIAGSNPSGDTPLEPVQATLDVVPIKTFLLSWEASAGAAFYRVLENPDGVSGYSQISEDLDPSVRQFDHEVALYNRINAQYIVQACNTSGCLDSDELFVAGSIQSAMGYFKASDARSGYRFGADVSLSGDGNTMAVGAPRKSIAASDNETTGGNSLLVHAGAVYVFVRNNGQWQEQAILSASNADAFDDFGSAVSLSADGNTLSVGATREDGGATGVDGDPDDNSRDSAGAVYTFVRNNGSWQQQAYIKQASHDFGKFFGLNVVLSTDGDTLVVHGADQVHIFKNTNGGWQQQARFQGTNTGSRGDGFGESVSLSIDAKTMAVGARIEDSAATGINGDEDDNSAPVSGAVYVYVESDGNWTREAYIKASDTSRDNFFGTAISLTANGDTLTVVSTSSAYTFNRSNGIWQQQEKWDNFIDEGSNFGGPLKISSDGTIMAARVWGMNNGVAIYKRINETWQREVILEAIDPWNGSFANTFSMSADGNTLAVGNYSEDSSSAGLNGDQNAIASPGDYGAVYLY